MAQNNTSIFKSWYSHPEWWINQGAEVAPISPGKVAWYTGMIPNNAIMPIEDSPWGAPNSYVGGETPWDGTGGVEDLMTANESGGGDGWYSPGTPKEPKLPPITWSDKYHVNGAPDWWRGKVPSRYDPQTEYATMLNSMLPYLSPEDQRYTASVLYRMYPDTFGGYNPETTNMPDIPGTVETQERRLMTSAKRAKQLLGTLNMVKQASPAGTEFGPGYAYLRQLASVMRDFGAKRNAGQTRQQYAQMAGALDPLAAETQGSQLSAFSELTRMLSQPYYTAGRVTPTSQLENGQTVFGEPIRNYF
jgi:hypothetical protein